MALPLVETDRGQAESVCCTSNKALLRIGGNWALACKAKITSPWRGEVVKHWIVRQWSGEYLATMASAFTIYDKFNG